MNKTELIKACQEKSSFELSQKCVAEVIDNAMDAIIKAVKKGDSVQLVGFGTFSLSERAARTGRNPQTGKEIKIKASKAPKFKAGKAFKDACNK